MGGKRWLIIRMNSEAYQSIIKMAFNLQLTSTLRLSYPSHFLHRESRPDSMPPIRQHRWSLRRRPSLAGRRRPSWPGWRSCRRKGSGSRPRRWSRCSLRPSKRPTGKFASSPPQFKRSYNFQLKSRRPHFYLKIIC